ncbi:MAG: ISAs1 family transposase [Thiotrichales bacterium]|nr:MAG: ISAs1 family transposase [Thiotrichales bacterium]
MKLTGTFIEHFTDIEDPRIHNHNYRHKLSDIFVITILATICGADGWVEIERFGLAKEEWFSSFLELPNGIPSHDTFGRIFSLLNPKLFEDSFISWIRSLSMDMTREIIALDGKSVRGSGSKVNNTAALHLVSAWASKNRMMLGQVKTADHSNEITAIPKLLDLIDVKGGIVTIDAMGCQTKIAKKIISQGADYVLSLKDNQPTLHEDVAAIFAKAETIQYKKILHRRKIEKIRDHGRIEKRRYTLLSARDPLLFELRWPGLRGLGKIEITRTINKQITRSTRYFISSLQYEDIDDFMRAVRQHWNIEINLHWSLDVSFKEDHCQINNGHAPENLALIRRIALNLLKQEKTLKNGITCKRKNAGWDHKYLLKVLQADSHLK